MGGLMNDTQDHGRYPTRVERRSDRDLHIVRRFDAPARLVFDAWTQPALFRRWWAPKSMGAEIVSCEMDVRTGGGYKLEFAHPSSPDTMAFFGRYIEVIPAERLCWTNEESTEGSVTTVTFAEENGQTLLTLHEAYPTKAALDQSIDGMEGGMAEQFAQLDELLEQL